VPDIEALVKLSKWVAVSWLVIQVRLGRNISAFVSNQHPLAFADP
jgi:hypothetical protein